MVPRRFSRSLTLKCSVSGKGCDIIIRYAGLAGRGLCSGCHLRGPKHTFGIGLECFFDGWGDLVVAVCQVCVCLLTTYLLLNIATYRRRKLKGRRAPFTPCMLDLNVGSGKAAACCIIATPRLVSKAVGTITGNVRRGKCHSCRRTKRAIFDVNKLKLADTAKVMHSTGNCLARHKSFIFGDSLGTFARVSKRGVVNLRLPTGGRDKSRVALCAMGVDSISVASRIGTPMFPLGRLR